MLKNSTNVSVDWVSETDIFTINLDNVGDDCPVFDGLFEYCSISAGGSMGMFFIYMYMHAINSEICYSRGRS